MCDQRLGYTHAGSPQLLKFAERTFRRLGAAQRGIDKQKSFGR
jgi:hypothetical protein